MESFTPILRLPTEASAQGGFALPWHEFIPTFRRESSRSKYETYSLSVT